MGVLELGSNAAHCCWLWSGRKQRSVSSLWTKKPADSSKELGTRVLQSSRAELWQCRWAQKQESSERKTGTLTSASDWSRKPLEPTLYFDLSVYKCVFQTTVCVNFLQPTKANVDNVADPLGFLSKHCLVLTNGSGCEKIHMCIFQDLYPCRIKLMTVSSWSTKRKYV